MLPYEKSQYYNRIKPDSLLEFADAYDYYQQQCNVDDDNLIDLRVYAWIGILSETVRTFIGDRSVEFGS